MIKKKLTALVCLILVGGLCIAELIYHRATPFQADDLWYATNLATGEPLRSIKDIWESMIWHYMNWGGRIISHAVLQFVILQGEEVADIVNLVMTLLLAYVCSAFAGRGTTRVCAFAAIYTLMVSLNPQKFFSMFWQAGCVNYVYTSILLIVYAKLYIDNAVNPNKKDLPGINVWIIVLGLATGCTNENMGPAAFLLSLISMVIISKKDRKIKLWQVTGSVCCLIGSAVMILAPGNFVREAFVTDHSLLGTIKVHMYDMAVAACDYLLPIFLVTVFIVAFVIAGRHEIDLSDKLMLAFGVIAYGGMALSPTFPSRATFGIMIVLLTADVSMVGKLCKNSANARRCVGVALVLSYIYAIGTVLINAIYYGGVQIQ